MSATQDFKDELATYTENEISKILINDTLEITSFYIKTVSDNVITLTFNVLKSQVSSITNIKVLKVDNSVIMNTNETITIVNDGVHLTYEIEVN